MDVPSFAYFTIWIPDVAAEQGWINKQMKETSAIMSITFCLDMVFYPGGIVTFLQLSLVFKEMDDRNESPVRKKGEIMG